MIVVGYTGTRYGMSEAQQSSVWHWLRLNMPSRAHHGCCVGGDAQFHHMCRKLGIPIEGWPPEKKEWQDLGLQGFDKMNDPQPYLDRNWDIVIAADHMLCCPHTEQEVMRGSGTWSTIRKSINLFRTQGIPKVWTYSPVSGLTLPNYTV